MRLAPTVNFILPGRKFILALVLILETLMLLSQVEDQPLAKLSPLLRQQAARQDGSAINTYVIAVSDLPAFRDFMDRELRIIPIYTYAPAGVFVIRIKWRDLLEKILPRPEVIFADQQRVPREEVAVSNLDLSANKINLVHSRYPQYNGEGMTVSVKEDRPDTADIDFKGRYLQVPAASSTLSSHATNMATIIAGAGNTYYEGKGAAPSARISSASFSSLLPEPDAFYQLYDITVQNHSYGTAIENYYGADAAAYDASIVSRDSLLHVFSAGNAGTQGAGTGIYAGLTGFANLTGSFKMGKNQLTVGHTDSTGNVLPASSRGPAYDGRLKPELVAFGEDGSSGAAAIVSGISLLLQQAYKNVQGRLPSSALARAILLNSADDTGPAGIDFLSGYGTANAFRAMQTVNLGRFRESSIQPGASQEFTITVPPGTRRLRVMLTWNDPPALPNAVKALRNDLDLEVEDPGGQAWLPWVLSHFPHPDSLQLLPQRRRDSLNITEQVTLDNPVAGNYIIRVKTFSLPASASQSYAIAYQFDSLDSFTWYYPSAIDNIFGGRANLLRWVSSYPATTGQLEYSLNAGSSWQLLDPAVDLSRGYLHWNAPDTFHTALLRLHIGAETFQSDTFTISRRINTMVGLNCPDSFLIFWNKRPGVNRYQLYQLGERYMEPFLQTTDTAVSLGKASHPSLYYAVAPVLESKTGVRSYGFNYTTQGVGCYFRSILLQLVNNTAELEILLGTLYQVEKLVLEKLTATGWVSLQETTSLAGLLIRFNDTALHPGSNTYRIRVELAGGRRFWSSEETLYYLGGSAFVVYPNPIEAGRDLRILAADDFIGSTMQVINMNGQKVYEAKVADINQLLPTGKFARGVYLFRFIPVNGKDRTIKIMIF